MGYELAPLAIVKKNRLYSQKRPKTPLKIWGPRVFVLAFLIT